MSPRDKRCLSNVVNSLTWIQSWPMRNLVRLPVWLPLVRQAAFVLGQYDDLILIHPINCFSGNLQAMLLLSQKTSIWQSKENNSLARRMCMVNCVNSPEDRGSIMASSPRGRRRYQNPWARWRWRKDSIFIPSKSE